MKVLFRIAILILSILLIFIVGRHYLVVDEHPKQSDIILVLSGDTGRLEKAADLFSKGYGKYVMISKAGEQGARAEDALEMGIPGNSLVLEDKATSTYTSALNTKSLIISNNLNTVIIVSSDYHMRRVKLTFDRVFEETDVKFFYVSSQRNKEKWFEDQQTIKITFVEFIKLAGYKLKLYKVFDV